MTVVPHGAGLGWRPETAYACAQRKISFAEIVAESMPKDGSLPAPLQQLVDRGLPVIVHGVSLSLGSADRPDRDRIARLRRLAHATRAPVVSEHIAFVRGSGMETDHLLPVPRTRAVLEIVIENVKRAQGELGAPLALENIAALFAWPDDAIPEGEFVREICERTGASLLLDVSNLAANAINFGRDEADFLDAIHGIPIAYAHAAGGAWRGDFFHDTHAHPIGQRSLALIARLVAQRGPLAVLLERDDGFGTRAALEAELDAIDVAARARTEAAHAL
jgi:uncharacterized protein